MRLFKIKVVKSRGQKESGQILLVVILAAVITLTVGLSVASRVVTNTKVTTDEVKTQQALSAAEAGIEQSLKTGAQINTPVTFKNNAQYQTTTTPITPQQFLINGGNSISQDDGTDVWLSNYGNGLKPAYGAPRDLSFNIFWQGSNSDCTKDPAIEVMILTGTADNPDLSREVFDSCQTRSSVNNFTYAAGVPASPVSGVNFDHVATITVNNGLVARVVPLYADSKLAVQLNGAVAGGIPSQGLLIESTGTAGNIKRTLQVFQGYPKLPTEFFYSLLIP